MAAENKTTELSCTPAVAEGHHDSLNDTSQGNSSLWLSGASVAQTLTASSLQTPVIGALSFQNTPTVHFTGHPFAVSVANAASTTASSFSPYKHHMTPFSSGDTERKGPVIVNPIAQQQSTGTVSARTVPTVRVAAQPAAVLDLSNNGILNTVLGRLPNLGTMVVQQLDPGSLLQKNVLAVIDSRTPVVSTAMAVPVVNVQPGLTLSYQGTVAAQPPRQVTSQIVCSVSQSSQLQHLLQPVVVNQVQSREPLVTYNLSAKQPIAHPRSSATASNTCIPQFPLANLPIARPTVMVRTLANISSGHTQLSLSVAASDGSRLSSANSAEMIPRKKRLHTASSLPGAFAHRHTTTAMQPVQQSTVLIANPAASETQHDVSSLPVQVQLVETVPTFVTDASGNLSLIHI